MDAIFEMTEPVLSLLAELVSEVPGLLGPGLLLLGVGLVSFALIDGLLERAADGRR